MKDVRSRTWAAHFPPQVDGDLVKDGVCGLFIAQKMHLSQPTVSEHLRVLSQAGLVRVLDHQPADPAERLAEITGGRGVDIILEMRADRSLAQDLTLLAMESGAARPVIGRQLALSESGRAHEAVLQNGAFGKIALMPLDEDAATVSG